ncbi:MAG TPA: ABC-F family ATP-binding cassette domain-containing protein [Planctomycetota bacterium]
MSVIAAQGLGKHYGTRTLFSEAEFTLSEGCRVGLIGANGSGKTTLFKMLLGVDDDHDGRLTRRRDLRIAALEQDPTFPEGVTVLEAMFSADPELLALEHEMHEIHHAMERGETTDAMLERLGECQHKFEERGGWEIESRAERILEGVGFPRALYESQVASLSGGEKGRLAFARILVQEPDLWLLDEPTNHLDIDGILFLEKFMRESKASAVIVSHDRRFLDRTTEQTWEIEANRFWQYNAPYSRAKELRAERLKATTRAYENQMAFIEKEAAFIRRYQAGQRARQATGRLKRLDRLARLERPEDRVRAMDLELNAGDSPGSKILKLREVGHQFGERVLFKGLELDLNRGEVLGVAGPNGAGKTTLLRILTGEMTPTEGKVLWGERVKLGILSQHETFPDEAATPYQFLRLTAPKLTEYQIRSLLGAMLFPGEAVDRPVHGLSGGERKRLMLTSMLVEGKNVLILDEPTNHLDIPSREALEIALATYEGTLIVVSHDRHFVDQMADRMLWIEDGETHLSEGGFADALERREKRKVAKAAARETVKKTAVVASTEPAKKSAWARLSKEELEARMAKNEARVNELEVAFTRSEFYLDAARMKSGTEEVARLKAELASLEEEWLTR